jgi:hypothetical protein
VPRVFDALQRLAPAVLRHVMAYGDLLYAEAGDAMRLSRRRAIGLTCAAYAATFAVLLGCFWAIAASWDGPNRWLVIGGLCLGFALLAFGSLLYARGGLSAGQPAPFDRLRAEWRADMRELSLLYPSLFLDDPKGALPSTAPAATGESRVR